MIDESKITHLLFNENQHSKAFELLLDAYQKPIYFYVRKIVLSHDDANDVSQQVFIKAWTGLKNFKGESRLSTWLYRIAFNESITFLEKRKRIIGVDLQQSSHQLPQVLMRDEWYAGDEIHAKLMAAVAILPEKQKEVFILKYFEEKKYDDISAITGTSIGALKASYHHAVSKIEAWIKNHNEW